jgi:hypothetical protein
MQDDKKPIRQTVTEYGGFAKNSEGEYQLLFVTEISESLCRNRTTEEAKRINSAELGMGRSIKFDPRDIVIKSREKETILHSWQELERLITDVTFDEVIPVPEIGETSIYFLIPVELGEELAGKQGFGRTKDTVYADFRIDVATTFNEDGAITGFDVPDGRIGAAVSRVERDRDTGYYEAFEWVDIEIPMGTAMEYLRLAAKEDPTAAQVLRAFEQG